MSNISSVNSTSISHTAPIAVDGPTVSSRFSETLSAVQTPKSWLTTAEASHALRPNIKEFMDRSGAEFLDASELIYGVVGSNTDVRDWSAIMASEDPIKAARQATGQMYGRTDVTPRTDATYMESSDTVAKEGNFAVRLLKDEDDHVLDQGLKLIDEQGLLLRDAGNNPQTIARNAWLFGFDTQPLTKLAEAAATVSEDLGKAVQQASLMVPATNQVVATSQLPVLALATENFTPFDLTGLTGPSTVAAKVDSVVKTLTDDQATSPSLEEVLQEATTNAFEYVDTATYLSSLFRA